ncbi:MAG: response regulator [bacterium]|nr:response regulator [bacterium]
MFVKRHVVSILLLICILMSGVGMHQANTAKSVARLTFKAAHEHNWFWADGWAHLFLNIAGRPTDTDAGQNLDELISSFESAKRMTDCFSSLRKMDEGITEREILDRFVQVFSVSEHQARQIVWVYKHHSRIFPEVDLLIDSTEKGSSYSQAIIGLIAAGNWQDNLSEFESNYDRMKSDESIFSGSTVRITQIADRFILIFISLLFLFTALLVLNIMRQYHNSANQTRLKMQNYISNIIDSMPSILIGVDANGNVTQWNCKAEEITGIKASQARGRTLEDVFPRMAQEMDRIAESIDTREIRCEMSKPVATTSGVQYEDITIYPLTANSVTGAVVRIDDVTKDFNLQAQLNQSRKMDAIGQLAGGVAHDFNNMLAGILGAADICKARARLDSDDERQIDMIIQASERAAELTTKLLTFSRKNPGVSAAADFHSVIEDALGLLERSINRKIRITTRMEAADSIVSGNCAELQNAIMNICINADHAMPDGGEISIETGNTILDEVDCKTSQFSIEPGNYIEIVIRDNGVGIPAKDLERIFEPFFTTRTVGHGTGLGLAAVYGIVQKHRGAIVVQSTINKGTTFRILLPCSEKSVIPAPTNQTTVSGTGLILLVDDEEIIRSTCELMLSNLGYTVIQAENGREAMEIFQARHEEIDLVMLDMIMPEMNGHETFLAMRNIDKNCKVIISSGFTEDADLDQLMSLGLSGFISKPYRKIELSHLLKTALDKQKTT